MKISNLHAVIFRGDAVSNIIFANDKIFKGRGWESNILVDLFAEIPSVTFVGRDYDKTPFVLRIQYLFSRFIRTNNKMHYLKEYFKTMKTYKKGKAKNQIESSDIRIWYYGAFYQLFRYFHNNDILFFVGITPPYLSDFSEFNMLSKNMLQATMDMNPFIITISQFLKKSIVDLGFKEQNVHVLPLFHKYTLPYQEHRHDKPKFVTWGRYAKNKAIPELVKVANAHNWKLRVFGDNISVNEFKTQYAEAQVNNKNGGVILSGKIDDFEQELTDANIYICNSFHEGFNMPAVEAMAHSLPVLLRKGTAMDELITEGKEGFLYDKLEELPNKIKIIMDNYKQFSKNAYQKSRYYTYKKYEGRLLKILKIYEENDGVL